jgi:TPR repeat protein
VELYALFAEMFIYGQRLEQDKEMAEFCYKSAIRLGNKFARKDLANMYLDE